MSDSTKPINESNLDQIEATTSTSDQSSSTTCCKYSSEENLNNFLLKTIKPFIYKLDQQVLAVQQSQKLLNDELNKLLEIFEQIKQPPSIIRSSSDDQSSIEQSNDPNNKDPDGKIVYAKQIFTNTDDVSMDIEEKSRRLLGLKRRLTLIHSILQTVNSRVKKILLAHDSRLL